MQKQFYKKPPILKFIPLGGAGTVTRNMFVYEYGEDILLVDCGIGFPEAEQLGVDVIIPDISYFAGKRDKIRALLISHAHEDHFGAIPYLIRNLGQPPIYAAKLARGFIQNKLTEFELLKGQSLHLIEPETDPFSLGVFQVTPFRVNHSVPDALGFSIQTPVGQIIHVPDFKFDWTPVDGKQFEVAKLTRLAAEGVLCLVSDCLGATTSGFTVSELKIQEAFEREFAKAEGQIFVTTLTSNISRIQQAINAAIKFDHQVCFLGRSMDENARIAQNLGYLSIPKKALVSPQKARSSPSKTVYFISGSYGQRNSALAKLARRENPSVTLQKNAVVIFSADPIPGVYDQVGVVIDRLTEQGARVVYSELQDDLHVSGHGIQGDLGLMIALTRPQFFIPIGGNPRHLRAYAGLVKDMGYDEESVFELQNGQSVEFKKGKARLGQTFKLRNIFVDGSRIGDVGKQVLQDRQILSEEGIFVVIVKKDERGGLKEEVDIVSRGFVYMAAADQLVEDAKDKVQKIIKGQKVGSWGNLKVHIEKKLADFLYARTERRPMILPVLIN